MSRWSWGKLHALPLRHVLSARGELGQLLDHGGLPVPGTMNTICNTTSGPDFAAKTGAGYRLIADLSASPPALWAVDAQSQSGHSGSPHYRDQLPEWAAGRYHLIPLDRSETVRLSVSRFTLQSRSVGVAITP
jgi:acyl-homoserine lactone acylase PvdQ